MIPPGPPNWGPPGGPPRGKKIQIFVPTGRVIKYPKKCALFCPPGGPAPRGPGGPPGGTPPGDPLSNINIIYIWPQPGGPGGVPGGPPGGPRGAPGGPRAGGGPGGPPGGNFPPPGPGAPGGPRRGVPEGSRPVPLPGALPWPPRQSVSPKHIQSYDRSAIVLPNIALTQRSVRVWLSQTPDLVVSGDVF